MSDKQDKQDKQDEQDEQQHAQKVKGHFPTTTLANQVRSLVGRLNTIYADDPVGAETSYGRIQKSIQRVRDRYGWSK